MTSKGRVRVAVPTDLDAVERLENAVFSSDELSRRSLRYYIHARTACFLVAEVAGDIIGDAIVAFRRGAKAARLYSIAVEPGQAGYGWGRRLLRACEDVASDRGCTTLRLEVRGDNAPALRFYEAAGYTRFGTYDDYYEDGASAWRYQRDLAGGSHREAPPA